MKFHVYFHRGTALVLKGSSLFSGLEMAASPDTRTWLISYRENWLLATDGMRLWVAYWTEQARRSWRSAIVTINQFDSDQTRSIVLFPATRPHVKRNERKQKNGQTRKTNKHITQKIHSTEFIYIISKHNVHYSTHYITVVKRKLPTSARILMTLLWRKPLHNCKKRFRTFIIARTNGKSRASPKD